jgi:hypothetical protein
MLRFGLQLAFLRGSEVVHRRANAPRLTLLVVALALAGCGGDDEPTASPTDSAAESARCVAADTNLMTPLGNGMKNEQHRLKNGQAVESQDDAGIYYVSAEIYGPEVEEGTIGTWATRSLGGAEAIWAIDDVSKEFPDHRDGVEAADLSASDSAADESRSCVEALG